MIVAKTVPELEAKGVVLCFEFFTDLIKFFPGIRELLDPHLGKPIGAPVHQLADIAEWDCLPFAVQEHGFLAGVIPATLCLAYFLGDITDVEIFFAKLTHLEEAIHRDVCSRPGLCYRADPSGQTTDARHLIIDLDPGLLLVGGGELVLHIFVERLDERAFVQDRDRLGLSPRRGCCAERGGGPAGRKLQKLSPRRRWRSCRLGHARSSIILGSGGFTTQAQLSCGAAIASDATSCVG